MNKLLVSVVLLGAMNLALAVPEVPKDLEYVSPLSETEKISDVQENDIHGLNQYFVDNNFVALNTGFGNGIDFFGVDQIYVRHEDNKVAFLLLNVTPKEKSQSGKLYTMDGNYLYHGMTPTGVSYALYMDNFQEKTAEQVSDFLESVRNAPKSSNTSLLRYILPMAQADYHGAPAAPRNGQATSQKSSYADGKIASGCKEAPCPDMDSDAQRITDAIVDGIGNCAVQVVCGGIDKTVGFGVRVIKKTIQFFTDSRTFWRETGNYFKDLFSGIGRIFGGGSAHVDHDTAEAFFGIPPKTRLERICRWAGEISGMMISGALIGHINLVQKMAHSLNNNLFKGLGGGMWRHTGIQLQKSELAAIKGALAALVANGLNRARLAAKNERCMSDSASSVPAGGKRYKEPSGK